MGAWFFPSRIEVLLDAAPQERAAGVLRSFERVGSVDYNESSTALCPAISAMATRSVGPLASPLALL